MAHECGTEGKHSRHCLEGYDASQYTVILLCCQRGMCLLLNQCSCQMLPSQFAADASPTKPALCSDGNQHPTTQLLIVIPCNISSLQILDCNYLGSNLQILCPHHPLAQYTLNQQNIPRSLDHRTSSEPRTSHRLNRKEGATQFRNGRIPLTSRVQTSRDSNKYNQYHNNFNSHRI